MDENVRKMLLQTTHWNDFHKIARKNRLEFSELDEALIKHYKSLMKKNPFGSFFNENGVHEDPLPKKHDK